MNIKAFIYLLSLSSIFAVSCTSSKSIKYNTTELKGLRIENDSLKNILAQNTVTMKNQIKTFLTFQDGNAENAMNFYVNLFENSSVVEVNRWAEGSPVEKGKIMFATFDLNGKLFMCSDSPPVHAWNFSPAVSNFVDCEDEAEQERLFTKLSENGEVTMPLNNYGFSKKFGWVIDQFGVSWQLNLN